MNLAPVQVEHAHGDGMRPLQLSDKGDRASDVSSVCDQVKNDAAPFRRGIGPRIACLEVEQFGRGLPRQARAGLRIVNLPFSVSDPVRSFSP